MPEQLAFTMLEVTNPYFHQKQFENADKRITLDKHKQSEAGKCQLRRVFKLYFDNPEGLTDREISDIYEDKFKIRCNPSTISARRNNIIEGEIPGYTIQPLIVDGKLYKRNGGQVNCLKNNS